VMVVVMGFLPPRPAPREPDKSTIYLILINI
jgi:hypothetical protein